MEPYNQGDLDQLCGLYAVVNSARLVANKREIDRDNQWQKLFSFLLDTLEKKGTLGAILKDGTSQPRLSIMLQTADTWLSKKHGVRLKYTKPFHRCSNASPKVVRKTISAHLSRNQTSAIIRLLQPDDHWTTVASMQSRSFDLFDSDGLQSLAHRHWGTGARAECEKRYRISPTSIFLIESQPDRR